jgi:hypothetical protein
VPVRPIREEAIRQVQAGQITWVELAIRMDMTSRSRHDPNRWYPDSTQVKRALGIKYKHGSRTKLTEGINRPTAHRFAKALGVNPGVWGLDASTE